MKLTNSFVRKLKAFDVVVIVFFSLLTLLNIIFHNKVLYWHIFVIANMLVILLVLSLAFLECKFKNKAIRIIHYWYIAPLILATFKELYFMIKPIRVQDYDHLFIEIDRWIFGTDPTIFLSHYANPYLTELLQFIYGIFYFLPIILGVALLRKNRFVEADYSVFLVIYGFYLSYLGYFALPGIGPRFTLHNFSTMDQTLPGVLLTNFMRELVNAAESVPPETANPSLFVQRDVFPSGHTMITLIVMYLSVKFNSRTKYFLLPVGVLLIFSTVYLWYHYVVDLIGGLIFMLFAVWSGKYIFNWWRKLTGKEELKLD